ncbi:hypothetical protein ACRAWD_09255 [Caulobacter segnis]
MTPSLPGHPGRQFHVHGTIPARLEQQGEFMAGKVGLVALPSLLAAQEAERGVAARVEENALIRAMLDAAAADSRPGHGGSSIDGRPDHHGPGPGQRRLAQGADRSARGRGGARRHGAPPRDPAALCANGRPAPAADLPALPAR